MIRIYSHDRKKKTKTKTVCRKFNELEWLVMLISDCDYGKFIKEL